MSASIRQLAAGELDVYGELVSFQGPDLRLNSRAAQALSLLLHELATNAAKYGALSTPTGRASVSWDKRDESFVFEWRERGGPHVTPPDRKGFGTTLIERLVAADLGEPPVLKFDTEGVICFLKTDLSNVVAKQAST